MADQYTPLEDKLEELFITGREELWRAGVVQSWDDFLQRRGYLNAIADAGDLIKQVRRPVADNHGEIASILPEGDV